MDMGAGESATALTVGAVVTWDGPTGEIPEGTPGEIVAIMGGGGRTVRFPSRSGALPLAELVLATPEQASQWAAVEAELEAKEVAEGLEERTRVAGEVSEFFVWADKDGDGHISFKEACAVFEFVHARGGEEDEALRIKLSVAAAAGKSFRDLKGLWEKWVGSGDKAGAGADATLGPNREQLWVGMQAVGCPRERFEDAWALVLAEARRVSSSLAARAAEPAPPQQLLEPPAAAAEGEGEHGSAIPDWVTDLLAALGRGEQVDPLRLQAALQLQAQGVAAAAEARQAQRVDQLREDQDRRIAALETQVKSLTGLLGTCVSYNDDVRAVSRTHQTTMFVHGMSFGEFVKQQKRIEDEVAAKEKSGEVEDVFAWADKDGDGHISFDEAWDVWKVACAVGHLQADHHQALFDDFFDDWWYKYLVENDKADARVDATLGPNLEQLWVLIRYCLETDFWERKIAGDMWPSLVKEARLAHFALLASQVRPMHALGDRDRMSSACPFNTGYLPLNYSGNPGVNGVSYRGINGKRWAITAASCVGSAAQ
jgi:Ca2+-binding EF-hand superfamily protein